MKRWMIWLALCLPALLAGCSASGAETVLAADPVMEPRARAEEPLAGEPAEGEAIRYTADIVNWSKNILSEEGVLLVSSNLQIPELTAWREDGTAVLEPATPQEERAAAVVETFNQRFEDWAVAGEFQEISAAAEARWQARQESGNAGIWILEYSLDLDSSVYQTDRMVSVAGTYRSFTGGAHEGTMLLSWNYDLTTGTFFDAPMLAEDGPAFLADVKDELYRQANTPHDTWSLLGGNLNGYIPAMDYWTGYENTLANWSSYAVSFNEEGMTVGFSPYELASYANGPQIFEISYDWLRPRLSQQGLITLGLAEPEQ